MKTINGERVEIISNDDYYDRFPHKELCEMCPEYRCDICYSCNIGMCGKVYVRIENNITWR